MRLGIFGGTFDPPHLGHLILASEAYHQLKLDRLLWVLTPHPPHKQNQHITPLKVRLEMLEVALAGAPEFELSTVDIDRLPPYYAVDTINILRETHPSGVLAYVMGSDSLRDLPAWHRPDVFLRACDILGVMRRPNDPVDLDLLETRLPGIKSKVRFIDASLHDISSTQIRCRVAQGAPYRCYIPAAMYKIIRRERLYRGVL
ncbi:MAG: nicotinate-nucleotide adenylyltransferase [Anaerolineales bacterium]